MVAFVLQVDELFSIACIYLVFAGWFIWRNQRRLVVASLLLVPAALSVMAHGIHPGDVGWRRKRVPCTLGETL